MAVMLHRSLLQAALLAGAVLLASEPAAAFVPSEAARQAIQGLKLLDPWVPVLLAMWLLLGAWSWWRLRQAAHSHQRQSVQLLPVWPLMFTVLVGLAVLWTGWAVLEPGSAGHERLLAWDYAAQHWSQQHVDEAMRGHLQRITGAGDLLWLGVLAALVGAILAWRRQWLLLLVWVFAIGLNGLSVRLLKQLFDRARPETLHELLTSGASFPSGHAAGATVVYGLLWCLLRPSLSAHQRRWLGAATALLVAIIAASRVGLQAHFATDVLAGTLWGLAICVLAAWALAQGRVRN